MRSILIAIASNSKKAVEEAIGIILALLMSFIASGIVIAVIIVTCW